MTDESDDVDQRLSEIEDRIRQAGARCHNRSEIRLAREGRQLAKQERRVIPYLSFSFNLINSADDVLAMKLGCEVAVEMIALLEDEERARQFQPDFPLEEYEHTRWWMTGFTYKKLATLTGHSQGYNSDGMHQCITDGMNVCRRTGNLRDTLHFREFAVEVYRSADDIDMALHFARGSLLLQDSDDSNRKVASADDVASLLCLQGNLNAAVEMAQQGWQYCNEFHHPYLAQLNFLPLAREVMCMAGRQDILDQLPVIVLDEESDGPVSTAQFLRIPPEDECPYFKFLRDESLATELSCKGEFEQALELLIPWDKRLLQEHCLSRWFNVRCRVVAAQRLAGHMDQARALARQCEEIAKKARDWVTLRRLDRLMDESIPANPLAGLGDADCGPFAVGTRISSSPIAETVAAAAPAKSVNAQDIEYSPLLSFVMSLRQRFLASAETPDERAAIAKDLLAIDPETVTDPRDAGHLLQLLRFVVAYGDPASFLDWGERMQKRFPTDATVVSVFAVLLVCLRELPDTGLDDVLTEQRIEGLFRQSMDLDVNHANNFARAGMYFLDQEKHGEAERCLARGFRLDRTSSLLASSLAQVYSATDRPRDALAVLDLALREGCEDPDIAWEAALRANGLEQYEPMLAYLDRHDELAPGKPWSNHYRAFALLELNRPDQALQALDREVECNPEMVYPVQVQRASAFGQLNRLDEFRQQLAEVLSIPMTSVTYLSPSGLQKLLHRLWLSSNLLPVDDPLRTMLQDHLVSTGLASDGFFQTLRRPDDNPRNVTDVQFYGVRIRQPLDVAWSTSRGCLAREEDWTSYEISWGVLARDEGEARRLVLAWQERCYPIPAEIVEVQTGEETYQDVPGIVWQGLREGQSDSGEE